MSYDDDDDDDDACVQICVANAFQESCSSAASAVSQLPYKHRQSFTSSDSMHARYSIVDANASATQPPQPIAARC